MKSLAAATSLCLLASLSAHADEAMTITRNGSQRSNKGSLAQLPLPARTGS